MNIVAKVTDTITMADKIEECLVGQGWVSEHFPRMQNMYVPCYFMYKEGFECKVIMEIFTGHGDIGMANYTPNNIDPRAYGLSFTLVDKNNNPLETYCKQTAICGSVLNVHNKEYKTTKHTDVRSCGAGIAFKSGKCELYFNYSETPTLSCTITAKIYDDDDECFQHVSFGDINKAGNYEGGAYLSASRSKFSLFPQEFTFENIVSTSVPIFCISKYPTTFAYAIYDGASNDDNIHRNNFLSTGEDLIRTETVEEDKYGNSTTHDVYRLGTGKKLAVSLVDNEYFGKSLNLPTYEFLQSHSAYDYNKVMNFVEAKDILLPIYLFGARDPAELDNYSYIGKVPNNYFTSVANMADGTIHTIKSVDETTECKYQIFPMTMRCGKHGYDGLAVKYDEIDYGI